MNALEARAIADAEAGATVYIAVLRDRDSWQSFTNCPHRHRSRETAEKCAEGYLWKALFGRTMPR